jgi:sulfatase-like protein
VAPRLVLGLLATACLTAAAIGCAADHARGGPEQPPVVLLILDEFPTDDLVGPDGRIDAARFPNFAALARTSTWFRNAVTTYDSTFKAVPSILDARLPAPGTAPDVRSHHRTIYHLFDRLDYDVVDVESGTALCPPYICPGARTRRPGVLARLAGDGRPSRLHAWIGAIHRRHQPTLYVQHALFPHEPWLYLPSGRQSRPSGEDPIKGVNKPSGFDDPVLTVHARQRHLLQVGFVDRQIGLLLARLRRTGLLDQALLVVVADHGYAFEVGVKERRQVSATNIDEIAPVPLFVKAPGQRVGRANDGFVRNIDVLPTIADLLDVHIAHRTDGVSAFAAASRARDTVTMARRDFSGIVSIDGDELVRRRQANRVRWTDLYGTGALSTVLYGDPWASVYRIGPHQDLLGQRVGPTATASARLVRAVMANADLLRAVSPGEQIVPTRVTGHIEGGGGPDAIRDLAVAVNGRIEAVGRSFRLGPRRPEFFSLLVPEDALRAGANDVRLYEVRGGSRLAELYGTR